MGYSGVNASWDTVTHDNSWTLLQSDPMASSSTVSAEVLVVGRELGTTNVIQAKVRGLFRRDGTGVLLSLLSTTFDTVFADRSLGALLWDARFRLNSDEYLYLDVKGKTSADVSWFATGWYYLIG